MQPPLFSSGTQPIARANNMLTAVPIWAALPFLPHTLNSLLVAPGVTSQLNHLPDSPWVSIYFWRSQE